MTPTSDYNRVVIVSVTSMDMQHMRSATNAVSKYMIIPPAMRECIQTIRAPRHELDLTDILRAVREAAAFEPPPRPQVRERPPAERLGPARVAGMDIRRFIPRRTGWRTATAAMAV